MGSLKIEALQCEKQREEETSKREGTCGSTKETHI